ncbi:MULTISPECIES: diacylglycerol kinase family protein [Gammaproteobacteria]|uniref:diacylglycerol/lipid kinase family protein n=1 Tax=Gammaproteobacteria TaxID=1236 RepID=UPI000DD07C02|nr:MULTISPECIES: YegS/Rv2252/BmrU family lipid kinase [Gammaproteobacteria]RTE87338.1 YegS/Rv2252/BmrU family lipid kinase [Aliidiomarina sp. B3213]TCZ92876.1 YegS/Rv2252/BmrU family lipid kinase [Lysobacter sp. N42]
MKTLIIFNPIYAEKRAKVLVMLKQKLKQLGREYVVFTTEPKLSEAKDKFSERLESFSDAIVIGGDGTLHQAVNLLTDFTGDIGYIPAGTGNDFGRYWLGLGKGLEFYIETAVLGKSESCDVGQVNDTKFIDSVGIGFDGALIKRIQSSKSFFPVLTYALSAIRMLFTYRGKPFSATTDEGAIEQLRCLMFVVANAPYYGAGMKVVPHADAQDGFLSYTCVEDRSIVAKMRGFAQIFKGTHTSKRFVTTGQFKSIDVTTDNLPMHADGEYIGETPAHISLATAQLHIRKRL